MKGLVRVRALVACGAAGGISATFNAPITGVFFGVEIILREFAVDALFTVMLSAMIADAVAIPFLGDKPFLSGFPAGITLVAGSPAKVTVTVNAVPTPTPPATPSPPPSASPVP